MYKTTAEAVLFAKELIGLMTDLKQNTAPPSQRDTGPYSVLNLSSDIAICAPFTQLASLKTALLGSGVALGAQNLHFAEEGAFTGEISADMLDEIGVDYCVIGHSERRAYFGETDETVNKKLKTALAHGIKPIFCVGETLEQRDANSQFDLVKAQLVKGFEGLESIPEDILGEVVVAYEPVWAIGTGRTASPEQAQEMCAFIRSEMSRIFNEKFSLNSCILYGGSVKPENAAEILQMTDIDGALVGGSSLVVKDFMAIIGAIAPN
jgi:triosephosphate isomerase